jgi:hypothetical protein
MVETSLVALLEIHLTPLLLKAALALEEPAILCL